MKIFSRTNLCCQWTLFLAMVFISLTSCKKEEPAKYSGEDFLYFMNKSNRFIMIPSAGNITNFYQPEIQFSFLLGQFQVDTFMFNQAGIGSFPLSIQFDGKVSDKNRKITLEVEGDGKEYCLMPHPDSVFIPANSNEYQLDLKIVRPKDLTDTSKKTITLKLKNSDLFSPEKHVWNTITYKIGNWYDIPRFYKDIAVSYGDFSPAKMYALQLAVDRVGGEVWGIDPDVITLNNFLATKAQKLINFNPFTNNDLYYFLDLWSYLRVNAPSGPNRIAFNNLTKKIIVLGKALLVERKNEGKPILDATGSEISFP